KANKIIANMQNQHNAEIKNITNNEIKKLKDEINQKENQINKLKIELQKKFVMTCNYLNRELPCTCTHYSQVEGSSN
ncbi:MAG: hypothetical protein IIT81_00320, partial [Mycoplasmataceae bacterium]|nr:hypothetical protein [Mycoplasmataceae bacterium]